MAAAFVAERAKAVAQDPSGATFMTFSVSGTTIGNLLVVATVAHSGATNTPLASVTDTGGNTWFLLGTPAPPSPQPSMGVAYTFLTAAPGTITLNFSGGSANILCWKCEEWSGLSALDVASTALGGQALASSGVTSSATPTAAGECAIAFFGTAGPMTAFTVGGSYTQAGTAANDSNASCACEYLLSASSGSQTASGSWTAGNENWSAQLAFFTITPPPPPPPWKMDKSTFPKPTMRLVA